MDPKIQVNIREYILMNREKKILRSSSRKFYIEEVCKIWRSVHNFLRNFDYRFQKWSFEKKAIKSLHSNNTWNFFFFSTHTESSIPAPYSKEYSRHIVLLSKQKKIDLLKFRNPPNPLKPKNRLPRFSPSNRS